MSNIFMKLAELIYKFVVLNLLWGVFVVLGLGVFGLMPATVALFRIIREWNNGRKEIPLVRSFWVYYKESLVKANLYGAMFFVMFYIIYVNVRFVSFFYDESIHFFLYIIMFAVGSIIIMTFLNLFSVMAHFDRKMFQYLKLAFGMVFAHPLKSFMQLFWVAAYGLAAIYYPKAFLFIGVSVFAYVIMSMNYATFNRYKKEIPAP
ncbi:YesL family protein [Shouchella sp. JSM 1781072]|uniref:YesL family protein n=1 Tax=Bacillaceae TaxID=186817 RepID=UPI0020D01BBD|nr:DUF624 domain-containing protein [Alkalihalobacillus sp. LMS6]UTR07223.1 DUF624 domain-containing protein [Alkalihalobacillus sp. LMS6]